MKIKFRLAVDVVMDLNGADKEAIRNKLLAIPRADLVEGQVVGDTGAQVQTINIVVAEYPA